jgi:hypothetical protein
MSDNWAISAISDPVGPHGSLQVAEGDQSQSRHNVAQILPFRTLTWAAE